MPWCSLVAPESAHAAAGCVQTAWVPSDGWRTTAEVASPARQSPTDWRAGLGGQLRAPWAPLGPPRAPGHKTGTGPRTCASSPVPAAPSRLTLNESRTPWGTLSSRTNLCQPHPPITSYFIKIFTFCVLGRSSVTPLGESSKKRTIKREVSPRALHAIFRKTSLSTVFSILTN